MAREQGNGVTIGISVNNNYLYINWSTSDEPWNNRTYISWNGGFHYTSSDAQLDDVDFSLNGLRYDNGGRVKSFSGTYTTRDHDITGGQGFYIDHDINGNASITISGSIGGSLSDRSTIGARTYSLTNYNRSAYQAGTPSVSRSSDGRTLYMSVGDPGAYNSGPQRDFEWQVHTAGGGWFGIGATDGTSNSYTVDPYTTYYVRVLAYNTDGNNGWSGESAASYGIPTAPISPSATRSTSVASRITLSWTAPSYVGAGISGYRIYRYHSTTGWQDLGTTGGTSFNNDTGIRGYTYEYDIYAYNSTGTGPVSARVSAMAPGVPGAPTLVASTELNPNPSRFGRNVTVRANKDANGYGNAVTEYRIQYATSDDNYTTWYGWNGTSGVLNAYNSFNIAGSEATFTYNMLTAAKTYKFRAYAVNSIGAGSQTTDSAVLATPFFLPASGKRWTGTSWEPTAVAKRWTPATGWTDVSTAKRYNGSSNSWEELT